MKLAINLSVGANIWECTKILQFHHNFENYMFLSGFTWMNPYINIKNILNI